MRRVVFTVLILALVLSGRTSAQMPTAQKWENVEWYSVFRWQLRGPDADSATTVFWDHALPIMAEVWPETTCLRLMTGEWSIICFGPMANGLETLEWELSPEWARFLSLFIERNGQAAMGMLQTFGSALARTESHIALKHTGGM
jgi:hypothetical protein